MSACERCWAEAGGNAGEYRRLLSLRSCTPEQQAGPDAGLCLHCGRRTRHQHTGECMVHGCDERRMMLNEEPRR